MRPTRWGYLIGLLVIVAGAVLAVGWVSVGVAGYRKDVNAFQRVPADAGGDVHLGQGGYVIYAETGAPNSSASVPPVAPPAPAVTVTAASGGAPLPLARYGSAANGRHGLTYVVGTHSGYAAETFSSPAAGTYRVAATAGGCFGTGDACGAVAIGRSIGPRLALTILGAVFIGFIGFVAGVVLLIATFVRRRRARKVAPYGGPGYPYPYPYASPPV